MERAGWIYGPSELERCGPLRGLLARFSELVLGLAVDEEAASPPERAPSPQRTRRPAPPASYQQVEFSFHRSESPATRALPETPPATPRPARRGARRLPLLERGKTLLHDRVEHYREQRQERRRLHREMRSLSARRAADESPRYAERKTTTHLGGIYVCLEKAGSVDRLPTVQDRLQLPRRRFDARINLWSSPVDTYHDWTLPRFPLRGRTSPTPARVGGNRI